MKREISIPKSKSVNVNEEAQVKQEVQQEETQQQEFEREKITKEESEYREKVFFEEDEQIRLRDGISYRIPPLGLKDAKNLMKKLNSIDTAIIIANLIENEDGSSSYDELLEVLLMGFKPYYPEMTVEYLEEYVDIVQAKEIIDILIGLNGLKKSL